MQGVQCTFLFLDADVIRSGRFDEAGYKTTLPRLQEMQAAHPEWIQRRVLKRHLAYGRHAYRGEILAVSHRWEQPDAPDASGAQLRAIREHLQSPAGLEVSFAWYALSTAVNRCCSRTPRCGTGGLRLVRLLVHAAGRADAHGEGRLQAHAAECSG